MQDPPSSQDQIEKTDTESDREGCCGQKQDEDKLKPHWLAASYYSLNNTATLMLNNKGPKDLKVRPTLFSMNGERLRLRPLTVAGNSFLSIDLGTWAAQGGDSFKEGSLQLFHTGKDLVLGAQVYLVDKQNSWSFEEKLSEFGNSNALRQEAVWSLPSPESEARLVLSNTSDAMLTVKARIRNQIVNWEQSWEVVLGPHQTRTFNVPNHGEAGISSASLEQTGTPGALLARVYTHNAQGYSSSTQFSNPDAGKSSSLHGAGLRLGVVAGEQLMPVIVARNVGDAETTLTGRIPYTTDDNQVKVLSIPEVQLAPGHATLIDLEKVLGTAALPESLTAGLEFEYTGAPGSVIMAAQSVSRSSNQVFRVPLWDPLAQRSPTGGYPWYIEGNSATTVFIKNITNHRQNYVGHVMFPGGSYSLGLQAVEGHQTVTLDLKSLRDNQVPDEEGRTIPLDAARGQIQWSLKQEGEQEQTDPLENLALIGRSEQVDLMAGISSNYACQNCCADSFLYGYITPESVTAPIYGPGNTGQFNAYEVLGNCYITPYARRVNNASWSSSNTLAATVDSDGVVTASGLGSTEIRASWWAREYFVEPCSVSEEPSDIKVIPQRPACGECDSISHRTTETAEFTAYGIQLGVEHIDIWPSGIPEIDHPNPGGSTTRVTVRTIGAVVPGVQVTMSAEAIVDNTQTDAGGHSGHAGPRPVGIFSDPGGDTGPTGEFTTTYTAPIFGGRMRIVGTFPNANNLSTAVNVLVSVPDLEQLQDGDHYNLRQVDPHHTAYHYGTSFANTNLVLVAADYKDMFYPAGGPAGEIPEDRKLVFNDQSLIYGGKFEIDADWRAAGGQGHAEHRTGRSCDVRSTNIPAERAEALWVLFLRRDFPTRVVHEPPDQPHWHVRSRQ